MHPILTTVLSLVFIFGCRSKDQESTENTESTSPDWWESETSDTAADNNQENNEETTEDEEWGDTAEKPDDTGVNSDDYPECGEDFDPDEPCEGDWSTTICVDNGLFWWCENGVWLNEDDK